MSMISLAAMPATIESKSDESFKSLLMFAGVGLVVSFALLAYGIDLSAI